MAFETWAYTLGSVILVSLVSFIGILFISMRKKFLEKILLLLVSFAVGALVGDAFIHLLPKAIEEGAEPSTFGAYALVGFMTFFVIEKVLRWQHRHLFSSHDHNMKSYTQPYVWMNLFGDGIHNFIDGAIIAGSYMISIPLGITTTVAVLLHEGAQEMGDFAVLVKGGLSKMKALFFNFLSSLTAIVGALLTLMTGEGIDSLSSFLVPFTFAGFIYIALANLIPELHHEEKPSQLVLQIIGVSAGIFVMAALLMIE
ncbi:MAG: ZIP family metal transporter [Candidatus Nanoarchaeia archaeon]